MNNLDELIAQYMALWHIPGPGDRLTAVAGLWTPDGTHAIPRGQFRGHQEISDRIATSYDQWVRPGGHIFVAAGDTDGHHHGVKFRWNMVTTNDQSLTSVGFDFLILDEAGLIQADYQFIET